MPVAVYRSVSTSPSVRNSVQVVAARQRAAEQQRQHICQLVQTATPHPKISHCQKRIKTSHPQNQRLVLVRKPCLEAGMKEIPSSGPIIGAAPKNTGRPGDKATVIR